jgi:hypothetical protein
MKKIPKELYNSLTPEMQQFFQTSLGFEVESQLPSKPCSPKTLLENYACVVETECRLCKNISTSVFLMSGIGGLLTSSPASLDEIDGMTIKTRSEAVLTCSNCRDYLAALTHPELIELTLRIAKGTLRTPLTPTN